MEEETTMASTKYSECKMVFFFFLDYIIISFFGRISFVMAESFSIQNADFIATARG